MNWQNNRFVQELSRSILLLDGATGTLLMEGNHTIHSIHSAYIAAGAHIITTNTFTANSIALQEQEPSLTGEALRERVYQLNKEGAAVARQAGALFVAGDMGPLNKSASMATNLEDPAAREVTFAQILEVYKDQVRGLRDGGVDLFLVETVFDTLNAKAALMAIEQEAPHLPIMLSATLSGSGGRILSGQTLEAFLISVQRPQVVSIGLNCSFGAQNMYPYIKELASKANCFTSAHPNAGLPNIYGQYDQTPELMAQALRPFIEESLVNIIGGCCGTRPEHIRAIAEMVRQSHAPLRQPSASFLQAPAPAPAPASLLPPKAVFSGLDPLYAHSFLCVGERTNVAGSRKFARLISEQQYDRAVDIAREMVRDGAQIIDVNMDHPLLDAPHAMRTFLNYLGADPQVARVPLMIDSSRWDVLEAGLQCVQGKCIVNSISLKEGEEVFKARATLLRQYGAAVMVMAFDEQGQATTYERRVAICERAYAILTKEIGFPPQDIIFDPNVLTVATGMEEHRSFALDFIRTVRYIKTHLPGALVSGGVSNLSFAFRGNETVREAMHAVFLYHAIGAGLDMAIIKPGAQPPYNQIPEDLREAIEAVILNTHAHATERLVELAAQIAQKELAQKAAAPTGAAPLAAHPTAKSALTAESASAASWRQESPAQRLSHALLHGIETYLAQDLAAIEAPNALAIVEGPLMDGMREVGQLFGQGKLFLPQVVKTARVMRKAVALLQPRMEQEKAVSSRETQRGIIATVEGDVHDIGKNLVTVVMECNGFKIIDLGVMVPSARIVEAVREHKAQFVCLSGLITPSLEEMIKVARDLDHVGVCVPLFIGGATTTAQFTALRIAPCYNGPVFHCKDASHNALLLARYFSQERDALLQELRAEQEEWRRSFRAKEAPKALPTERLLPPNPFTPPFTGSQTFSLPYSELVRNLNWQALYSAWGIKPTQVRRDPKAQEQAQSLREHALALLETLTAQWGPQACARAVVGFYPADVHNDLLRLYNPQALDAAPLLELPVSHVLAQYVKASAPCAQCYAGPAQSPAQTPAQTPAGSSIDHVGLFVLTASGEWQEAQVARWQQEGDVYRATLWQTLMDCLAEAYSAYLHKHLVNSGIRPAFGYPMCPLHRLKAPVMDLLQARERLGLRLTSSYMIQPAASVCGLYITHPQARYHTP